MVSPSSPVVAVGRALAGVPRPLQGALIGFSVFAVLGGIVGLVIGWRANPMTTWFAVFEIGVPAGFIGALLGAAVGTVAMLLPRSRH